MTIWGAVPCMAPVWDQRHGGAAYNCFCVPHLNVPDGLCLPMAPRPPTPPSYFTIHRDCHCIYGLVATGVLGPVNIVGRVRAVRLSVGLRTAGIPFCSRGLRATSLRYSRHCSSAFGRILCPFLWRGSRLSASVASQSRRKRQACCTSQKMGVTRGSSTSLTLQVGPLCSVRCAPGRVVHGRACCMLHVEGCAFVLCCVVGRSLGRRRHGRGRG